MKRTLTKGEATPETVRSMLFSQKVRCGVLAENLPEKRRRRRELPSFRRPSPNRGIENISVERFVNALERLNSADRRLLQRGRPEAASGLVRALKLTEQAAKAGAALLTGVQNVPTGVALWCPHSPGKPDGFRGGPRHHRHHRRHMQSTGVRPPLRRLGKMRRPERGCWQNARRRDAKQAECPRRPRPRTLLLAVGQKLNPDNRTLGGRLGEPALFWAVPWMPNGYIAPGAKATIVCRWQRPR